METVKRGDALELLVKGLTTIGEETKTFTCFSEGDLTLSSKGILSLRTSKNAGTALYVENPARIILTLQ